MKEQDFYLSILSLILVAAAVLLFFKGCSPSRTGGMKKAAASSEETVNMRTGDQICYASAPDPIHLKEKKDIGLIYADNEVIVQLSTLLSEKEASSLAEEHGAELVGFINVSGTCQWRFDKEKTLDELEELIRNLSEKSAIEAAFLQTVSSSAGTRRHYPHSYPSDAIPNEGRAFNSKKEARWGYIDIHAKAAYDAKDRMKTPVNIGIYDSTFSAEPTELGNITAGCPQYGGRDRKKISSHGTHVTGIAAAKCGNGNGIAGVYPCPGNAQVYINSWLSPSWEAGDSIDNKSLMQKMRDYAWFLYHDVRVINNSFSLGEEAIHGILHEIEIGSKKTGDCEYFLLKQPAECYAIFFDRFIDAGYQFLLVSASGNDSARSLGTNIVRHFEEGEKIKSPVVETKYVSVLNYISKESVKDRIIVVGGYRKDHKVNSDSNGGSRTDIMAPGDHIYSTIGDGKYAYMTGTSQAAPYVTGAIASIWSLDSSRTAAEVRSLLLREGSDLTDDDYIKDQKNGSRIIKLDVKKSLDLAQKSNPEIKGPEDAAPAQPSSELVQIRVFLQNKKSYNEIKTANVTITDENGTVYYDRERIAYPAEESITDQSKKFSYYGYSSAFFLPLPEGSYKARIEADGIEETLTVDGLNPAEDYCGQKDLWKLVQKVLNEGEDIPQWTFVIQTAAQDINQVHLQVSDEDRFREFISRQNYHFIRTGSFPSVPGTEWSGAEDPGWTAEDITGVISLDIADYDNDSKKELLVLSLETKGETWYDSPIQTTYLHLSMYEVNGSKVTCADNLAIPVSKSLHETLRVSDQMNCFTVTDTNGIAIVLNCQEWCEESAQTINIYRYDGKFRYAKGTAFLKMGEGDLYFWTANKESGWLSATQALEILNDPGQWNLQERYLAEEHDWKPADQVKQAQFAENYLKELSWTGTDLRIFDPSPPSDFVSAYDRVHNLTAGDIYGNKGLKGYHPLCTVFLRHQLGQSPEWTLICTDESMAKNLR